MSVDHLKNVLHNNSSYINNLILLSNNINGLSNDDKRKLLSKYIKTVNAEIILLQEIHDNKYLNKGEFLNFKKYYSIESEKKWGVAILIKSTHNSKLKKLSKMRLAA
jgi:exonuclease III